MQLKESTYKLQSSLAGYCRTGEVDQVAGVDLSRVTHYRRLVFNVVKDSLLSAYPLTNSLLTEDEWGSLMHEFFSIHNCQSFQIWQMPKELYDFILNKNHLLSQKYVMLSELLLFEWLEVDLYMSEDIESVYQLDGDELNGKLVINPEIRLQHFHYPVHLKKANEISKSDYGDYFLSIHRHPLTSKVMFTNLSVALVRVLELLMSDPQTVEGLALQVCDEFKINNQELVLKNLTDFSRNALSNKLVLGYTF